MKNNGTLKLFTLLCVLGSAICYFVVPYLQYPELSGSWLSAKITYKNISCVDIFYNANKFGINDNMTTLLLGLIIMSIILVIGLVADKNNSKIFFSLVAVSQILSGILNGYIFYTFDKIKSSAYGITGIVMDAVNIKLIYGIYLNIGLIILALILSIIGITNNGKVPNNI